MAFSETARLIWSETPAGKSALIAFLKQEHGWQEVAEYLAKDAYFSEVKRAEFYTHTMRNGQSIDKAESAIQRTKFYCSRFQSKQATTTAELYPATKQYGLSLGDCAGLALGLKPFTTSNYC